MLRILGKKALNSNFRDLLNAANQTQQCSVRGFKSDLKIKWVRPEKISCIKPEKSGDLKAMPELDKSQTQLAYRDCKELETANDLVKKLFSLEFAPRFKSTAVYNKKIMDSVRRHALDNSSIEAKIARWTGCIRSMQDLMERFPRNKRMKVRLKELIDRRKKHLKYLRRWDYKKFEWLLEKLDIIYKSPPSEFHWITRKDSLRKLTDLHCENIKTERLNIFRKALEEEQPAFLQEKIRTLEFIREEEKECGAKETVTQEEIDEVKAQLDQLMKERAVQTKLVEEQTELSIQ